MKKPARLKITEEALNVFLERIKLGMSPPKAAVSVGWARSSFYYKMQNDLKFRKLVEEADSTIDVITHKHNLALIKSGDSKIIINQLKRLDKKEESTSFKAALITAQQKAIADRDFDLARRIQDEIDDQ